ncbi:MAG: hypothetical protein HRU81_12265 [Gammaproteobacteria bacterium]|nr:MAG: hypothetical protein HRU81_12265 [Gammaproteobacteria bacterium]
MTRLHQFFLGISITALAACGGGEVPAPGNSAASPASTATPPAAPASADGITARAFLEQALAEARAWQPDAELVGVSTSLADGPRNTFWFYDVQSPGQGRCTRIRALENGDVENVGTGGACVLMKPVSAGFVDSPAAWQAARAAGFAGGDSVQLSLRYQRDAALPEPQPCWVLWSDADGGGQAGLIRGWCVDPASGQFVVRLSGQGRPDPLQ